MDPVVWVYVALATGVAGLVLATAFARRVLAADPGNERMQELMEVIRQGSMTFLRREYTAVAVFVLAMAGLIFALLDWGRPWGSIAYVTGALLSASAGLVGMRIATAANTRTAEAAPAAAASPRRSDRLPGGSGDGVHRCRSRPARAGPRLSGCSIEVLGVRVGRDPRRHRPRRLVGRLVRQGRRGDLHQGGRRGRRPGRQGRGGDPRGRSPQPGR